MDSNVVSSDQAVNKNHGNTSLLIPIFEPSKGGEDARSTDLLNKSRILLASQEVVATPDSVCGT
ncbi:MAG: hypothetical protein GPJ54_00580 [Candidatus Heimdallarchaeota archaeon]|nr:hypothetical protein [Candidatus Heimdallarchaeota archaeon]